MLITNSRSGPGRRVRLRVMLLSALLVSGAGQATGLAPEHEVRRLMLATEEAVKAERWADAGEYLNRLRTMEGEKPADYFYFRGRAMLNASHLNEARSALETYVGRVGADGQYYQQALKLITDIEKVSRANVRALAEANGEVSEPVAVIEPAGQERLDTLRQLYLASSDREALTLHLNAVLDTAAWRRDKTVVQLDRPADIQYQVSLDGDDLNVQEIRRELDARVVRKSMTLPVFGVNPQLRWDCEPAVAACWVYDPRDGSRLFQLAQDQDKAQEVARTLGRLIRNLQQGGSDGR
ncbi:MAG TPA: hypothetical protein VKY53_02835 [Marinobacter sp.]|nr:hypothetical protein [Marinobacter sp.]